MQREKLTNPHIKQQHSKSPYHQAATTLHQVLFPMLTFQQLDAYARTSKANLSATRPERAARLLQQVVYGNQQNATRMLKLDPELLLATACATDYSGRTIKATALQAAIAAGDVEMAEMMKTVFAKLKNGQSLLAAQFKKIFPNGIQAVINAQQENVYDLTPIANAINEAKPDHLQAALDKQFDLKIPLHASLIQFRAKFTKRSHAEFIYNPYHLLQAFTVYEQHYERWNWPQADLFWRQVIGFMQRYLPANYAQAFAQRLYYIVSKKEPLRRSFKFRWQPELAIFPPMARQGLGFSWAAAGATRRVGSVGGPRCATRPNFQALCQTNTSGLGRLLDATTHRAADPVALSAKIMPQRL